MLRDARSVRLQETRFAQATIVIILGYCVAENRSPSHYNLFVRNEEAELYLDIWLADFPAASPHQLTGKDLALTERKGSGREKKIRGCRLAFYCLRAGPAILRRVFQQNIAASMSRRRNGTLAREVLPVLFNMVAKMALSRRYIVSDRDISCMRNVYCECFNPRRMLTGFGEPGSIPCGVAPRFLHLESCRAMRLVASFSWRSPVSPALAVRRCFILTSLHPYLLIRLSQVGIVLNDAVGRRVFSAISRFPRPFIPAVLHTHLNHPHQLSRHR
ncbi:hypothetical protein PR048_013644, partial [Dryococelus australis]